MLNIKQDLLPIGVIGLLSISPYLPGISKDFVFDDRPAILKNKDISNPSPSDIFLHDFWGGNLTASSSHKSYRPFTSLTFWIQTIADGEASAVNMKILNIALHFFSTILFYYMTLSLQFIDQKLRVKELRFISFFSAAIFGCHPVHVEPIVSIVGRADILYSCIFIISSCLLLRWHPVNVTPTLVKNVVLSVLTALSMLCKEQGILFLIFWLILQLIKTKFVRKELFSRKFSLFCLYIVINLVFLANLRMSFMNYEKPKFQKGDNPAAFEKSWIKRILTFNYIYVINFYILVLPQWLCFDWAMGCISVLSSFDYRIYFVIFLWNLLLSMAVKSVHEIKKQNFLLLYILALLIIPFILSMNIFVHVGFVIAERNLYLSVAGYSLLVAKGIQKISSVLNGVHKKCMHLFVLIMFLSFVMRSYERSHQWKKEIDLFSSGLNVCYKNAKVHYNIAKKLVDQKKIEDAVVFYKESVRLEPEYEHALNNLGNLLKTQKKFAEAEKLLRKATEINPKFAAAFMNLAIVEQAQGDFDQSERDYLKALDLRAVYPDCQFNLGNLYLKTKQLEKAEFRFVLATKHKHQLAFANLIILFDEQERLEEAHNSILEAHGLFPENPEFMFQLANSFGKQVNTSVCKMRSEHQIFEFQGKFVESEAMYLKAISLEGKGLYWSNLGVLYHRWGKMIKAEEAYTTALQIDNSLGSARINLAKLRNKLKN